MSLVPEGLSWLAETPNGRSWLAGLDQEVAAATERWSLTVDAPYPASHVSLVLPAIASGEPVVLKIPFPHRESEHEGMALRSWRGRGAIRLLDEDATTGALLLERCVPGQHLSTLPADDALDVLLALVPTLLIPAGAPFTPLTDEARRWIVNIPTAWESAGRPFPRRFVDAALGALRDLTAGDQPESVLLHQDLHADNVLSSKRQPWLVIDPKPLVGDPAFAPAPIVRSSELGHSREAVLNRLNRCCTAWGLDPTRARGWALAQTVAWSFEGESVLPGHIEIAEWLLSET